MPMSVTICRMFRNWNLTVLIVITMKISFHNTVILLISVEIRKVPRDSYKHHKRFI